jgi:transcriptional regulator with XRE-family HTH domain
MKYQAAGNYLRAHRKKSGLSQRDVGRLLGFKHPGPISRHERAMTAPSLATALAYELIFHTSVAALFAGTRDAIARDVEMKLKEMGAMLGSRNARDRNANLIAQKLSWLSERQKVRSKH